MIFVCKLCYSYCRVFPPSQSVLEWDFHSVTSIIIHSIINNEIIKHNYLKLSVTILLLTSIYKREDTYGDGRTLDNCVTKSLDNLWQTGIGQLRREKPTKSLRALYKRMETMWTTFIQHNFFFQDSVKHCIWNCKFVTSY